MRFILLLFLASPAMSQTGTLPQSVNDQATNNDLTYLYQQVVNSPNQLGRNGLVCTNQSGNCITFSNGNVLNSTTSLVVLDNSSFTFIPETSVASNTFGTCIASVTFNVANVPIDIIINGSLVSPSGASKEMGWSILVDGKFPTVGGTTPFTSTIGIGASAAVGSGVCGDVSGQLRIDKLSAGSHSFCVTIADGNNVAIKFLAGTTLCNSAFSMKSSMLVKEAH